MSEFLQIAQVIADLSTLQNAEPQPANSVLSSTNKSLPPNFLRRTSKEAIQPEQPKFDKFGRRILRAPPQLTRANSSFSSAAGTGSNTPVPSSSPEGEERDVDFARAKRLLELYSERDKLDDSGLARAKGRVEKVMETYAKKGLEEREKAARVRQLGADPSTK